MSGKSAKIKRKAAPPQIPPAPRGREIINKEYSELCTQIGDSYIKFKGLEMQLKAFERIVENLGNEMAALNKREELAKEPAALPEASPEEQPSQIEGAV